MFGLQTSNEYQPLTWVKRVPVYAITIFVVLNVVGMFVTAIGGAANANLALLVFDPVSFLHGRIWTLLTYAFLNPPNFFFPFSMLFLYSSGVEVERYLGRQQFLKLLGLLLLFPSMALLVWSSLGVPVLGYAGSADVTLGMIIAFATLYPNLELMGWVTLKWIAFAGLVLSAMACLPQHNWPELSIVLGMSAVSFGCVRLIQRGGLEVLPKWTMPAAPKRSPRSRAKARPVDDDAEDVHTSIDPLLEKIARSGLNSLTAKERAQLERARQTLLNKH